MGRSLRDIASAETLHPAVHYLQLIETLFSQRLAQLRSNSKSSLSSTASDDSVRSVSPPVVARPPSGSHPRSVSPPEYRLSPVSQLALDSAISKLDSIQSPMLEVSSRAAPEAALRRPLPALGVGVTGAPPTPPSSGVAAGAPAGVDANSKASLATPSLWVPQLPEENRNWVRKSFSDSQQWLSTPVVDRSFEETVNRIELKPIEKERSPDSLPAPPPGLAARAPRPKLQSTEPTSIDDGPPAVKPQPQLVRVEPPVWFAAKNWKAAASQLSPV